MLRLVTDKDAGKKLLRYSIAASEEDIHEIDEWRRQQPDLPGRSEAIRRLVKKALADEVATERAHAGRKPRAGKAA